MLATLGKTAVPDDYDQSPQGREPEERRIPPREWLRRLEERRAREGPPQSSGSEEISAAAERARRQLREDIEEVRAGLAGVLGGESGESERPTAGDWCERAEERLLWRELEALRYRMETLDKELRRAQKRRARKSERRLSRTIKERVDKAIEESRLRAEAQIRADLERMLDDLLEELRSIGGRAGGR